MLEHENLLFEFAAEPKDESRLKDPLSEQLTEFREFGKETRVIQTQSQTLGGKPLQVATCVNEFWTAKQRAASSLHEISYRACFKPQLPRFFIQRLTEPGDLVYDPFMGRGTSLIEAALLGRTPFGCDINPLSVFLTRPRLHPPTLEQVIERFRHINLANADEPPEYLLVFYHPETRREICALKKYFLQRKADGNLDAVDEWIWMIALPR